jgi:N6-adenosine-specific RNA methylase IME4
MVCRATSLVRGRTPRAHYGCLSFDQHAALPVADICAPDAFLFSWMPLRSVDLVVPLMTAWGFKFSGTAFAWVKLNKKCPGFWMGGGYGTRKNLEVC